MCAFAVNKLVARVVALSRSGSNIRACIRKLPRIRECQLGAGDAQH
jgi:hypothetical protein